MSEPKKQRTNEPAPEAPPEQDQPEGANEWTAMAEVYAARLVPAFGNIYNLIATTLASTTSAHSAQEGAPGSVLDFGTGPGQPARTLKSKFPSSTVVGVDSSSGMIGLAKSHSGEGLSFELLEPGGRSLSDTVDKKTFDVVVTSFTVCYMDHAARVAWLNSLAPILAPGGKVVMVNWTQPKHVDWLAAVKGLMLWKTGEQREGDSIGNVVVPGDDDDLDAALNSGSFALATQAPTEKFVAEADGWKLASWDIQDVVVPFANIEALYGFVEQAPFLNKDVDLPLMQELVAARHERRIAAGQPGILSKPEQPENLEQELLFPTKLSVATIVRS